MFKVGVTGYVRYLFLFQFSTGSLLYLTTCWQLPVILLTHYSTLITSSFLHFISQFGPTYVC